MEESRRERQGFRCQRFHAQRTCVRSRDGRCLCEGHACNEMMTALCGSRGIVADDATGRFAAQFAHPVYVARKHALGPL